MRAGARKKAREGRPGIRFVWLAPVSSNINPGVLAESDLMLRKTALRRLSTWLIGLFFLAQIGGVVQLLGEHTAHVGESQLAVAHPMAGDRVSHGHHHDGDADGAIQHHALQDLNGAPLRLISSCEFDLTPDTIAAAAPDVLTGRNPVLPERPPKPFLSV